MNARDIVKEANPSSLELRKKIDGRSARVAVMGLGYVGLPLAGAIAEAGYGVLAYDRDEEKVRALERGENYLDHLGKDFARRLAENGRFEPTARSERLTDADVVVICVPTPLGRHQEPDLSFVEDSAASLRLRPGQLIVLTSTTYPGTTREKVLPILERSGLKCGEDFFLAYSPEREDPGRSNVTTVQIPRLVGGIDSVSAELTLALYRMVVDEVFLVESAEVAEAAKLLENIYRAVNIALVNELKVLLTQMGIDVWKVIEAASTKPFGFQPFYPGPGLGGHCIPIDPFYLSWKAKEVGLHTRFIELAGQVNTEMPRYVVGRVMEALNEKGRALRDSRILICGVTYKPNVQDVRETPAAEIIDLLWEGGARVCYHDPFIPVFPSMRKHDIRLESESLSPALLESLDCIVVVTDHDAIDWPLIGKHGKLIVDTRNVSHRLGATSAHVVKA